MPTWRSIASVSCWCTFGELRPGIAAAPPQQAGNVFHVEMRERRSLFNCSHAIGIATGALRLRAHRIRRDGRRILRIAQVVDEDAALARRLRHVRREAIAETSRTSNSAIALQNAFAWSHRAWARSARRRAGPCRRSSSRMHREAERVEQLAQHVDARRRCCPSRASRPDRSRTPAGRDATASARASPTDAAPARPSAAARRPH